MKTPKATTSAFLCGALLIIALDDLARGFYWRAVLGAVFCAGNAIEWRRSAKEAA